MSETATDKASISEIQQEIIDEFSFFEDWTEKYRYIIEMGKDLDPIDGQYKTEDYKIHGCQSNVWIKAEEKNGRVFYKADSDALIVKGLIAMLFRILSGQKAADVAKADLFVYEKIGMHEHLSPTRSNGLAAMIKQVKLYAVAIQQKLESKK